MGVSGITTLLKKEAPTAYFSLALSELTGRRVAIDALNWMYSNMAIARRKVIDRHNVLEGEPDPLAIRREWYGMVMKFVASWLAYGVTPVFVFDGAAPPEKDATKAKRRADKQKCRDQITKLYAQVEEQQGLVAPDLVAELAKHLRNYNTIPPEEFELFPLVLRSIGIPVLQGVGDGERLCAALCREGKVAAVFSTDTDTLFHGCPLMITRFSEEWAFAADGSRVGQVECVRLDLILDGLSMTEEQFRDLGIMCGCDFNNNIPKVGPVRSLGLLRKHGSIDYIPLDTTCLNHRRCRELFFPLPWNQLVEGEVVLEVRQDHLVTARDILEMVGAGGQVARLVQLYRTLPSPREGILLARELTLTLPADPGPYLTLTVIG
jgi:flap endonuclease-1